MDPSSWEPVGLIHLDTRLLQMFAAAGSHSETRGLCSTRTGQWNDPEDSPHEARPTSCFSKANTGIRFIMSESWTKRAVFLGSCYWGYTPHGPGFGDKDPVTHGVIFKVLPHYLNQQHKHGMTRSQGFSSPVSQMHVGLPSSCLEELPVRSSEFFTKIRKKSCERAGLNCTLSTQKSQFSFFSNTR